MATKKLSAKISKELELFLELSKDRDVKAVNIIDDGEGFRATLLTMRNGQLVEVEMSKNDVWAYAAGKFKLFAAIHFLKNMKNLIRKTLSP